MSTFLLNNGPHYWDVVQDDNFKREYTVKFKAGTDEPFVHDDDPSNFANTPGLPTVGSSWTQFATALGTNGGDDWAFRTPYIKATPYDNNDEPAEVYELELKFKSPDYEQKRCQTNTFEDPLDEPIQIRVGWQKYRKIPNLDRDGLPYCGTTGEPLVGQEIEIEDNHWTVEFTINQFNINLSLIDSLANTLNSGPVWGLAPEKSMFSSFSASKLYYGTCHAYIRSTYGFEIRADWTQYLPDKGRMKYTGTDPTDPTHWQVSKDRYGENIPVMRLDTSGLAIVSSTQIPNTIVRNPYHTGNHLLLGIPSSF